MFTQLERKLLHNQRDPFVLTESSEDSILKQAKDKMRKKNHFNRLFTGVTGIQRKSRVKLTDFDGHVESDLQISEISSDSE